MHHILVASASCWLDASDFGVFVLALRALSTDSVCNVRIVPYFFATGFGEIRSRPRCFSLHFETVLVVRRTSFLDDLPLSLRRQTVGEPVHVPSSPIVLVCSFRRRVC